MPSRNIHAVAPRKWQSAFAPGQRAKDLLRADIEKMEQNKLGLSEVEKQQAALASQTAAAQQAQALQRNVQQQAMAGGGFSGQQAEAQRQIALQAGEAAAGTRPQIDELSARIAEARRQQIIERLDAERALRREKTKNTLRTIGKTVSGAVTGFMAGGPVGAVAGGVGGLASGLGGTK